VPVATVAVVSLHGDDGLHDLSEACGLAPAERGGQPGVGVVLPGVTHAQAATHQHHEALRPTPLHGHDPDVVGEHVDAVVTRPGQADLELPGQVDVAVEGLLGGLRRGRRRHGLLTVEPDLVVRPGLGPETGREVTGVGQEGVLTPVVVGGGAARHVADDVAAGRQGADQVAVERPHEVPEVALDDAVVLDALAGGDAQRPPAHLVGQPVEGQPLVGGEHPAGHRGAHHAGVGQLLAGLGPGPPLVTIVLLVDPVELQQHGAVGGEAVAVVGQLGGQLAAQVGAAALDVLGRGGNGRSGLLRAGFLRARFLRRRHEATRYLNPTKAINIWGNLS
jgi:hypothetical protein